MSANELPHTPSAASNVQPSCEQRYHDACSGGAGNGGGGAGEGGGRAPTGGGEGGGNASTWRRRPSSLLCRYAHTADSTSACSVTGLHVADSSTATGDASGDGCSGRVIDITHV